MTPIWYKGEAMLFMGPQTAVCVLVCVRERECACVRMHACAHVRAWERKRLCACTAGDKGLWLQRVTWLSLTIWCVIRYHVTGEFNIELVKQRKRKLDTQIQNTCSVHYLLNYWKIPDCVFSFLNTIILSFHLVSVAPITELENKNKLSDWMFVSWWVVVNAFFKVFFAPRLISLTF